MDKSPILAEKYAKALFDYAVEHNCLEEVDAQFGLMDKAFALLPGALEALALPVVSQEEKFSLIDEAAKASSMDVGFSNFIKLLIEKKRIELFSDIYRKFRVFYNIHHHKMDVVVVSASPLSEEERQLFLHIWGSYLGMFLDVKEEVDEDLIDGIKVYYKGYCYDASLKRRLELLREEMGRWN